jgi:hypothetical protein
VIQTVFTSDAASMNGRSSERVQSRRGLDQVRLRLPADLASIIGARGWGRSSSRVESR